MTENKIAIFRPHFMELTNHNWGSLVLKVQGQLPAFFRKLRSRSDIYDFVTDLLKTTITIKGLFLNRA